MTARETGAVEPATVLFSDGRVPEPLGDEGRQWLLRQLAAWPKRVHEDRTCCIGALMDMATAEFCRLMSERTRPQPTPATREIVERLRTAAAELNEQVDTIAALLRKWGVDHAAFAKPGTKAGSVMLDAVAAFEQQAATIAERDAERAELLNDITVMMSEFVDNWPQPKKVSTALALIAKTMRAALDPPRHKFWGAGEPDCPREIKAGNGELHTLRCKVCGEDNPRGEICRAPFRATLERTRGQ